MVSVWTSPRPWSSERHLGNDDGRTWETFVRYAKHSILGLHGERTTAPDQTVSDIAGRRAMRIVRSPRRAM